MKNDVRWPAHTTHMCRNAFELPLLAHPRLPELVCRVPLYSVGLLPAWAWETMWTLVLINQEGNVFESQRPCSPLRHKCLSLLDIPGPITIQLRTTGVWHTARLTQHAQDAEFQPYPKLPSFKGPNHCGGSILETLLCAWFAQVRPGGVLCLLVRTTACNLQLHVRDTTALWHGKGWGCFD